MSEKGVDKRERIQSIDALRGLAVILMVVYHFLYDLVVFAGAPGWLFINPFTKPLQTLIAVSFIMIAGVSSYFSCDNIKRGLRVLAAAGVITLVTLFMHMPILFGILHFLGVAMLFYGTVHNFLENLQLKILPWLYVLLLGASILLLRHVEMQYKYMWILGFTFDGFVSYDYFPLFPWIFVFLFGTWLGRPLKERRLPLWVYTINPPVLPNLGRNTFIIYLLHQPILYCLTMLARL